MYSSTKIKARNFLSNIAYRRISKKDFVSASFIVDMLSYIIVNVKPFFLSTNYPELEHQGMVRMLWEKCLSARFYEHVRKAENFEILNSGKTTFKQCKAIVCAYVQQPDIWQELMKYVQMFNTNYQYIYSLLFPLNYLKANKHGIKNRNSFSLCFSEWKSDEYKQEQLGKNPFNFYVERNESHPFEQKPMKDNFEVEVINKTSSNIQKKEINGEKYRADVVDTNNKENIPPSVQLSKRKFVYVPTMTNLKEEFDKLYKLPKTKKKRTPPYVDKLEKRGKKKEELTTRLKEVDEKMKLIKKK